MNNLMRMELREVDSIQYDEFMGETEAQQKERYKIKDLDSANWAFRKLKAIEEQRQEYKDLLDKEIERLKLWYEVETKGLDNSKSFFESLLIEYYIESRDSDPKFKLTTPYGKVTSRKQQPKWNYEDEAVIKSLKKHKLEEFIRIKEEVNKVDLKKEVEVLESIYTLNGEVVENIQEKENGLFVNTETGEIDDVNQYDYHEKAVVMNGNIIEGITLQEQADSISIKVVE